MKEKMKRIFLGSTDILLLVMIFTYFLITKRIDYNEIKASKSVLDIGSEYGISIIGFIFIFPAFVFTIIKLCMDKKMIGFMGSMFNLFCAIFSFISGIIGIFYFLEFIYIPIVIIICSSILLIFSLLEILKIFKSFDGDTKTIE